MKGGERQDTASLVKLLKVVFITSYA